jgi:hypothetical protein
VFAFSLWLASNKDMMMSGGPLFPVSNQQIRFNKLFRSFLNEHSQLVHACGCDTDLLGVHSFWKGALTFLSSGSTAGPTSGAICQRAGWSQGKVNDTYILFKRVDSCRSEHPSTYICIPSSSVRRLGRHRWCKSFLLVFFSFLICYMSSNSLVHFPCYRRLL